MKLIQVREVPMRRVVIGTIAVLVLVAWSGSDGVYPAESLIAGVDGVRPEPVQISGKEGVKPAPIQYAGKDRDGLALQVAGNSGVRTIAGVDGGKPLQRAGQDRGGAPVHIAGLDGGHPAVMQLAGEGTHGAPVIAGMMA
jgi:hypothetical protein